MNKHERPTCTRCGTCCILGACAWGVEHAETGVCMYLIPYGDNKTTCRLIEDDEDIAAEMLGTGCPIKGSPILFAEAEKSARLNMELLVKHKHEGIKWIEWEESDDPSTPGELGYP